MIYTYRLYAIRALPLAKEELITDCRHFQVFKLPDIYMCQFRH